MEASPQLNPHGGSGQRHSLPSRLLQTQPDAVLCRLAGRGNAGAFEALYGRHHRGVYGFVFHLLGRGATAEDAEDIAQEAFSTAFNRLAEHRPEASFRSWLYTIARNRAYDQIRARKPLPEDVAEFPLVSGTGTEGDAERRANMAWLVGAMGELPERQREALVMRELGGLSYGEIASGLDTTVPGVKQLINRARGTLASAAEDEDLRPPRKLAKQLNALVPALPLAAGGTAATAIGIGGSATVAGAGGLSAVTKIAATVLAAAAIGGGAAGIDRATGDGDGDASATRSAAAAKSVAGGDASADSTSPGRGNSGTGQDRSGSNGSSGSGHGRGERRADREDGGSDRSGDGTDRRSESGESDSDRSGQRRESSSDDDAKSESADQQDHGAEGGSESSGHETGDDASSGGDSGSEPESGDSGDGGGGDDGAEPRAEGADSEIELPETGH